MNTIDDLVKQIDRAQNDNERVKLLIEIAITYLNTNNIEESKHYARLAVSIAKGCNNIYEEGRALNILGNTAGVEGNVNDAIQYYTIAKDKFEQVHNFQKVSTVLGNLAITYKSKSQYDIALEYYQKALEIDFRIENKPGLIQHFGNRGNLYMTIGDYTKSLADYKQALELADEIEDSLALTRITGYTGGVYYQLHDVTKALEFYKKALHLAIVNENTYSIALNNTNIAGVYYDEGQYNLALEYLYSALSVYQNSQNKYEQITILGNIANVHKELSDFENSFDYANKALVIAQEYNDLANIALYYGLLGILYKENNFSKFDERLSEEFLLKSLEINSELGIKHSMYFNYTALSELYEQLGNYKLAFDYFKKYHNLEKEVQNEDAKKAAQRLAYERKETEKEKERIVERATAAAQIAEQERLLHSILPPEVAVRLLNNETFIADHYDSVSVLFMDIVNFTPLASRIPPKSLVYLLDCIFTKADEIIKQHGLEKIKTIGDAYMVVAGAPEPRSDHAQAIAHFAVDMIEVMNSFTSKTTHQHIQLRVGIHSGEVVAGVIGKKKFQYDLWGDAVNTASRMESHGEPGKIHISEAFVYHLTQTLSQREGFTSVSFPLGEDRDGVIIPRGEIEIKGKGMMKTYFLERA